MATRIILFIFTAVLLCCKEEIVEPACPEQYHYIEEGFSTLLPNQSQSYLSIWKRQHYRVNQLNDDEFPTWFQSYGFSTKGAMDSAMTFRVDYILEWDWMEIQHYDEFYVFLTHNITEFQEHQLPRNELLTEEWIEYIVDTTIMSKPFSELNLDSSPRYESCLNALEELRSLSGIEELQFHDIVLWVELKSPSFDGDPYLVAIEQDDQNTSNCTYAHLNLINGDWGLVEKDCALIN